MSVSRRKFLGVSGAAVGLGILGVVGLLEAEAGAPVTPRGRVPASPSGPTAPSAGYRLVLADDFNGSSLDPGLWTPTREYPNAGQINRGFTDYEVNAFDSDMVSVGNSCAILKGKKRTVRADTGRSYDYTTGVISTSNASPGFLFSPARGGPFYIECRTKIPGTAPNAGTSLFPAFWAVTTQRMNAFAYTREMDFFEFTKNSSLYDSVNLYPQGGVGSHTDVINNGAFFQKTLATDMALAFHVYTVQVNADGSFSSWIDGAYQWTLPPHPATDWMCMILNYSLDDRPLDGWTGDEYLIDYVSIWQSAEVSAGDGVVGGGVTPGTYGL